MLLCMLVTIREQSIPFGENHKLIEYSWDPYMEIDVSKLTKMEKWGACLLLLKPVVPELLIS